MSEPLHRGVRLLVPLLLLLLLAGVVIVKEVIVVVVVKVVEVEEIAVEVEVGEVSGVIVAGINVFVASGAGGVAAMKARWW